MKLKNIAALYLTSHEWMELAEASRRFYTRALKLLNGLMEMEADKISRPMVIDLKDKLFEKGGMCRAAIAVLNNILRYGYDRGLCNHNHAASLSHMPHKVPRPRWTDEECDIFEANAKPYIRAVFMLALYTGQRRSDLYRMRWEQYDGETIKFLQMKTRTLLYIPVHPKLKVELERLKALAGTYKGRAPSPYILVNYFGDPWSMLTMTMTVTNEAKRLGFKNRTLHGLRKTTAAKLAEAGCPPHLIAAITGHKTLSEIMNYTAEADQIKMAKEAMEKWTDAA